MLGRIFTLVFALVIGTRVNLLRGSDTLSCRQLTDIVGQSQPIDWVRAAALQTEAGSHPQLKCLAQQSMALLLIRSNRFSEAWKQLAEVDTLLNDTSVGLRFQQAKLKLWLLVQARSPQAEDQLKALVTQVLKTDTKENDRQDACLFLGKLLKVLHGCEVSCGVSKPIIDRTKQLLETQSSQPSVASFQSGWSASQDWEREVRSLLARCTDKAASQLVAEELSRRQQATEKLCSEVEARHKDEKTKENELDVQRRAALRHQKELVVDMRRPTPGMPRQPTMEHVSGTGSKSTTSERKTYDKERDRAYDKYQKEVSEYPAKLQAWQDRDRVRRELLAKNKSAADAALSAAEMKVSAQEAIVDGLHNQLRLHEVAIDGLCHQLSAARALAARTDNSTPTIDLLQKPAYYPIIDFSQEAMRLSKMVSKPAPAKN